LLEVRITDYFLSRETTEWQIVITHSPDS